MLLPAAAPHWPVETLLLVDSPAMLCSSRMGRMGGGAEPLTRRLTPSPPPKPDPLSIATCMAARTLALLSGDCWATGTGDEGRNSEDHKYGEDNLVWP